MMPYTYAGKVHQDRISHKFHIFNKHIPAKYFIYCDSFNSHLEPSSDCDRLMMGLDENRN